jgi:hypothetical protein
MSHIDRVRHLTRIHSHKENNLEDCAKKSPGRAKSENEIVYQNDYHCNEGNVLVGWNATIRDREQRGEMAVVNY